jgi:hypothetical protein
MNCAICNREAPADFDDVINEGWISSFFAGQQQMEGPFVTNASTSIGG